ncbi:Uncharacterised protein [Vibrio cholerae]|nr:Uncharacterised protein [Vibrio cholerae]
MLLQTNTLLQIRVLVSIQIYPNHLELQVGGK